MSNVCIKYYRNILNYVLKLISYFKVKCPDKVFLDFLELIWRLYHQGSQLEILLEKKGITNKKNILRK